MALSTKRFGARYGIKPKAKFAAVEALHRGRKSCPYCQKRALQRQAAGIWHCRSCKVTFTGKAYTI